MRWHNRYPDGFIRLREKFLLFPKWIGGECRWLEKTKWKQKYVVYSGWLTNEWIDIEWYKDPPPDGLSLAQSALISTERYKADEATLSALRGYFSDPEDTIDTKEDLNL